jgi:hypothetical protein
MSSSLRRRAHCGLSQYPVQPGHCSQKGTPVAAACCNTEPWPGIPIITVGQPSVITPPCAVGSPIRAAIMFPIKTVGDPIKIVSGGPTHVHMSVARAAGMLPMRTVGQPGGKMGPPTCGTIPVTIGQVCKSVTRAAGGIASFR